MRRRSDVDVMMTCQNLEADVRASERETRQSRARSTVTTIESSHSSSIVLFYFVSC